MSNHDFNPRTDNAGHSNPVSTAGETVTVACKIPVGLMMQLYELQDKEVQRPDGSTAVVKMSVPTCAAIRLNGAAKFRGTNHETEHEIRNGAGLTYGVPVEIWDAWLKANKDADFIKKGLVFAHRTDTRGMSREHVGALSGMEPINPKAKSVDPQTRGTIEKAA